MKTIALLCVGAALALAADQDQDKKATDQKTANPKPAPAAPAKAIPQAKRHLNQRAVAPVEPQQTPQQKAAAALPSLPLGAEEVGSNLYRYTDTQGKHWMYRKTPFGVSKWEEKPEDQQPAAKIRSTAGITATDLGDSVQFQRSSPFGPETWTRKKSELTDDEKAVFAAAAKPSDPGKPSEKQ